MRELRGKTALVTGAASGIGRATAEALRREGAELVLCDLDEPRLGEVAVRLGARLARRVDVSDAKQMQAFAEQVHELVPALDVLVNNAGIGLSGGLLDTTLEDWERVLSVNLRGVVHGCHFFVPPMVRRGAGGQVVNVSSGLGYVGAPGVIGYVTSKFGVLGLSESLRAELREHRIGVSTICPGIVATDIIRTTRFAGQADPEAKRARVQRVYEQRGYGPERVAAAIVSAIRRDRAVVPVTPESWLLYYVKRVSPALSALLAGAMHRRIGGG